MDNKETLNLFPQPVFKYKVNNFKEYNKKLSEYIYNLNREDKEGVQRSNKGGWHSKSFKFKDTNSIQHKFFQKQPNMYLMLFKLMVGYWNLIKLYAQKCGL